MSYRDDLQALTMRRTTLKRELGELHLLMSQAAELQPRLRELERQLADCTNNIDQARARERARALPMLAQVRVASPCNENWEQMSGDERVRHCGRCDKKVYNLSAMNAEQAEELLRESGEPRCVRFYRRADGTILSGDCSVGARKRRRRKGFVAALIAGAVAAGALGGIASGLFRPDPGMVMGEMTPAEFYPAQQSAEPGVYIKYAKPPPPRSFEEHPGWDVE
ncbi:hypothetical protein [Haliangium ochraceum]|uniref:Uncharacterized protein n=1 Tax=Haliangium ochraceum (strain DSM 14365 / JCM 11303 / SMP-2) TaxID=502025 RepID=D0LV58_HALO1|nr:hypothetical protein [Haliangium ochraceum]ACY15899.1 hypothetical protein Hoch_3397 [Haliangium ochraceum DSM 14365]